VEPLVSILIPAHNAARWVGDTLRSAIGQTWRRKEIILVDDGSTDKTLQIAKDFCSAQTKVVAQEKQGAAAARNKALALSQGDYIQWLDADDLLAPDKVELQIKTIDAAASKRTLFSGPWGSFCYRTSTANFCPSPLWCDLSPVEWFIKKWEYNAHMQTATWLISRELTEMAGPWDMRLFSNDDGEYLSRIIKHSDTIKFVPEAKVFYRVTGSSRLSYVGQSDEKIKAFLLGVQLQIQHVLSLENSEKTRAACVKKLQLGLLHFYPERPELVHEVEEIATALGGKLEVPKLSWKYTWIQKAFGWSAAKRFRMWYNRRKSDIIRSWDAVLFHVEERGGRLRQRSGAD